MSTCLPTPLISRLKMPCILHRTSGAPCAESFQQGIRKVCEEKVGHAEVPVNIAKHLKIHLASCSRTGQIDPVGIASSPFTSFYVYYILCIMCLCVCPSIIFNGKVANHKTAPESPSRWDQPSRNLQEAPSRMNLRIRQTSDLDYNTTTAAKYGLNTSRKTERHELRKVVKLTQI